MISPNKTRSSLWQILWRLFVVISEEIDRECTVWSEILRCSTLDVSLNILKPTLKIWTVICEISTTRKYPLHGYILGVLTHTTALNQLWGDDKTLNMWFWNWVYAPQLRLGRSSQTWHLELWPCGFKIEYTHLGFASAAAVLLGSEGYPGCIFYTLNTYQATFIRDILC